MPRRSILVVYFLFMTAFAGATEIQTDAETLQGTILGKQGEEIFFETQNGIVNIRKADILSIDGKPYIYAAPKPAALPMPTPVNDAGVPAQESLDSKAPARKLNADDILVHPSGITEKDLREYYSAHREEFRKPRMVHVSFLGQAFFTRSESEIRSDPSSEGGWRDGGWIEEGKTVEPFEETVLRQVFDLTVGGVSRLVKDKNGVWYLLRVVERNESAIPPFKEIRPKVLNKILQSRNLTGE